MFLIDMSVPKGSNQSQIRIGWWGNGYLSARTPPQQDGADPLSDRVGLDVNCRGEVPRIYKTLLSTATGMTFPTEAAFRNIRQDFENG